MANGRTNNVKPIASWSVIPKTGIVLITGHIGTGKSATAWWLAEMAHSKGHQVAAYAFTKQAKRALPAWVKKNASTVRDVTRLKPCVVVVDEAALNANARRSMSEENVDWMKLAAIVRHKGHLLIYIAQHLRQIDAQIVAAADLVVMKRPSQLHLRFARPELRPELEQAYDAFNKVKGDKRKWAYVVSYHEGMTGMLRSKMPTFWTDKLSKAFAAVDFDDLDGKKIEAKGVRKRAKSKANK